MYENKSNVHMHLITCETVLSVHILIISCLLRFKKRFGFTKYLCTQECKYDSWHSNKHLGLGQWAMPLSTVLIAPYRCNKARPVGIYVCCSWTHYISMSMFVIFLLNLPSLVNTRRSIDWWRLCFFSWFPCLCVSFDRAVVLSGFF